MLSESPEATNFSNRCSTQRGGCWVYVMRQRRLLQVLLLVLLVLLTTLLLHAHWRAAPTEQLYGHTLQLFRDGSQHPLTSYLDRKLKVRKWCRTCIGMSWVQSSSNDAGDVSVKLCYLQAEKFEINSPSISPFPCSKKIQPPIKVPYRRRSNFNLYTCYFPMCAGGYCNSNS